MMIPCARKKEQQMKSTAPKKLPWLLSDHLSGLSTSSFTVAVAEEFVVMTGMTFLRVEQDMYSFWTWLVVVFAIYLYMHSIQFVAFLG
jgi:hypothetical protein